MQRICRRQSLSTISSSFVERFEPEKVMARETVRGFAARRETPGLTFDLADLARNLIKDLFDTYRPELHYMRGPGPKWRAKHEPTLRFGPNVAPLMPVSHARVLLLTSICHGASIVLGIALPQAYRRPMPLSDAEALARTVGE